MKSFAAGIDARAGRCAIHGKALVALCGSVVLAAWHGHASAQNKAMPQVMSESEVSEATRRQAEGPMRFILQMDATKDKKPVAPKEPKPAPALAGKPKPVGPAASVANAPAPGPALDAKPADAADAPTQVATVAPARDAKPAPVVDTPAPAPAEPIPQPTLLTMVEPEISAPLKRRLHGAQTAMVRINVAADGSVADAEVLQVSNAALRQPVLDAVKQWRYSPPGQVVPQTLELQLVDMQE